MAGLGLSVASQQSPSAPANPILPTGPCGHRDVNTGPCGCEQFWDKGGVEIHHGSKERRTSSDRSTWCVCGHHACFHKTMVATPIAHFGALGTCGGRCQSHCGTRCDLHNTLQSKLDDKRMSHQRQSVGHWQSRLRVDFGQQSRHSGTTPNASPVAEGSHQDSSLPSTSELPPIPSICLLSNDRPARVGKETGRDARRLQETPAGLGLSVDATGTPANPIERPPSIASTIPDDCALGRFLNPSAYDQDLPSTRANSVAGERASRPCATPESLNKILEESTPLQLNIESDTIPNTFIPDDLIPSATEVATPSIANTPDLAMVDQTIKEGQKFIEGLMQITSKAEQPTSGEGQSADITSAPSPHLLLTSPAALPEQLQILFKSASPRDFQKMVSYLAPLHSLLSSMPHVVNTVRDLSDRLAILENANSSFNYVHPDELQEQLDGYDTRMMDVENRIDEHERHHRSTEFDYSNASYNRRVAYAVTESLSSNRSFDSTTSSALILAAIDRKDMASEIGEIKDRLDMLEAAALPTSLRPWDIEVVFLPWGSQLRGIWFAADELLTVASKPMTQDLEEWTQSRSSIVNPARPTLASLRECDSSPPGQPGEGSGGWSSQDISVWATGTHDELLLPKACGTNGLVYKRLRSRGLVKDVTIKSGSAREIQATLAYAFHDFMPHLKYPLDNEETNTTGDAYPGLRAAFIPLRKVIHESRLRFLSPAEMANHSLWDAQFLAAGILMRVSGGRKRLYVTQRDAYIQEDSDSSVPWTWSALRQLPRFHPDADVTMVGDDDHEQPQVAEADAKEACWSFVEAYDAVPFSLHSSFGSRHSGQTSMRSADRDWRRSMTPTSILKNRPTQPISPLSELHPRPPHQRTVSAPAVEPTVSSSSKRRLNSSPIKQSSVPLATSRLPSASVTRQKRRRVGESTSPQPEVNRGEAQVTIWANTPRRSREPPSPFLMLNSHLPRSNSDLTSRPSQKSVAMVSKSTPSAYATPHSGAFANPCVAAGDTEADDAMYQDDGELSWPGVTTTGDEDSASNGDNARPDAEEEEMESLGDIESAFISDDEGESSYDEDSDDAQHDDEDPLDTLLGVLRN